MTAHPSRERSRSGEEDRPLCPRCGRQAGLLLARPPGPFNSVFRCAGSEQACGYLWSPQHPGGAVGSVT